MTPKEFKFLVVTLERAAQEAYKEGYNDAISDKSLNIGQFKMNRMSQLTLKSALEKYIESA